MGPVKYLSINLPVRFIHNHIFSGFLLHRKNIILSLQSISNWGALNKRAEIILIEPAPGNAGEGM